jgi:hypothetical protein
VVDSPVLFRSHTPVAEAAHEAPTNSLLRATTIGELLGIAFALGAGSFGKLSEREVAWRRRVKAPTQTVIQEFAESIRAGNDPLGDSLQELLGATRRRERGAVYTPRVVVDRMLAWGGAAGVPSRVVDPGTGSGRFLVSALRTFGSKVPLIGIEIDPRASLIARANLCALGADPKAVTIVNQDFCRADLVRMEETLWVGNPPYLS